MQAPSSTRWQTYFPGPPTVLGGPGTPGNGFPVAAGPSGAVLVTFTVWRPQRRRTPGDPGGSQWIDIGGLTYLVNPFGARPLMCPQSSYVTTDPNLGMPPANVPGRDMSGQPGGGLTDQAADQAADQANTLSFTVNLTQCLAVRGISFNPGDELGIQLQARASNTKPDTATQAFTVTRK